MPQDTPYSKKELQSLEKFSKSIGGGTFNEFWENAFTITGEKVNLPYKEMFDTYRSSIEHDLARSKGMKTGPLNRRKIRDLFDKTYKDFNTMEKTAIPHSRFYIRLKIDQANEDPSPKNIFMMQKAINTLREPSGMGAMISEDGVIGSETRRAVKDFRDYDEKISSFKVSEALQERRMPFFKKKGDKE